jgi:hypothetical protein
MATFKLGDRVRVKFYFDKDHHNNFTGTIISIDSKFDIYTILAEKTLKKDRFHKSWVSKI